MPRHVRNFWLELTVDGKKTPVKTGPVRKDGGFELKVFIRDKGQVKEAGIVRGMAFSNGYLGLKFSLFPYLNPKCTFVKRDDN